MRRCCNSIWNNLEINEGYKIRVRKGCSFLGEEGGDTPNNGLYGEAPFERGIFFRLQVYERVSFGSVKGPERASTDEFYGFRKSKKRSFFANDYHLKFSPFTAVKGDTKF